MATIRFDAHTVTLREGESVLDGLLRVGAPCAFSCKKGSCHTCLMRAPAMDAPAASERGVSSDLTAAGHFLPCIAHPTADLTIAPADMTAVWMDALVVEKTVRSPSVVELQLEPMRAFNWKGGQFVNLQGPDGAVRSYSLASRVNDYFLHLHIERVSGGAVSPWVHDTLAAGDMVRIQGPVGACVYAEADKTRPLLMVATGTGLAPVLGVLKDALAEGHTGPITLFHAARSPAESYARADLEALASAHPNLSVTCLTDGSDVVKAALGDAAAHTSPDVPAPDRAGHVLYVCGNPDMVYKARTAAVLHGIHRRDIHADPFTPPEPVMPRDTEKLAAWPKEPALWNALEDGALLRPILQAFYDAVYEDEVLSPFFAHATKERAISKQYEFLYAVFTGQITYFGMKPFNAHHWMVISDDVFDYREDLFERVVRAHMHDEPQIRRWLAFQELFRREIVKPARRGLIVDGKEQPIKGYTDEVLEFGMVCDGCTAEMPAGSTGRLHELTGQLYCATCSQGAG